MRVKTSLLLLFSGLQNLLHILALKVRMTSLILTVTWDMNTVFLLGVNRDIKDSHDVRGPVCRDRDPHRDLRSLNPPLTTSSIWRLTFYLKGIFSHLNLPSLFSSWRVTELLEMPSSVWLFVFLSQKVPDWDDQWFRNDSWHLRTIIIYEVFVICLILVTIYKKGIYSSFMGTKVRIQSVPSNQGHVAAKWTTQVSTQTFLSLNPM